jgi:hypothetical protein
MKIRLAVPLLCALAVQVLTPLPARAADPAPLLTTDELKKLVDSGQYRDALKAMLPILVLKGPAAAPYNRHEILMLKAECQLQLKMNREALDTLDLARKEALAVPDQPSAAQALALTHLIQKSPGLNYTPKTGTSRKPITIVDRTLRKGAYDALFADELAPLQQKAKAALAGKSLVPIAEASKLLGGVRAVEFVSTGSNKETEQLTADLTKQSLKLFNDALEDLTARTQRISDSANRIVTENMNVTDSTGRTWVQQQTRRKGLTPQDSQTLKGIQTESAKIPQAASDLAQALGADNAPFKAVAGKAEVLRDKVNTVLTDDYSAVINQTVPDRVPR